MKLAVLGGVAVICAATAIVAAQQAAPTDQTQTVIGCVRGEGTAQAPWVLAGVVIPPAPAAGAGRRRRWTRRRAAVVARLAPAVKAAVLHRRLRLRHLPLRRLRRSICGSPVSI